jgi:tetratricopeptide (TPR) repeat protein
MLSLQSFLFLSARKRLVLLVIIIALPTLLQAPAKSTYADPKTLVVNESHRKILESATRLYEQGNKLGALNQLRTLAESENVEVAIHVQLGDWFRDSGEYESAVLWYQRGTASLKQAVETFPLDLRFRLGATLVLLKRYREAIPELELALQHKSFDPEDARLYKMLSNAYEMSGAWSEAYQANLSILSTDPADAEAWKTMARLEAKLPAINNVGLSKTNAPLPPDIGDFKNVIDLGNPLDWSFRKLENGMRSYIKYSDDLAQLKRPVSARRFRRVASLLALFLGTVSLRENRPADCIKAYSLIETAMPVNALEVQLQRTVFHNLIRAYGDVGQYVHAIAAGNRLTQLPASFEERGGDTRQILSLLERVFTSVSWEGHAQQPREDDADDFVDLGLVGPPRAAMPIPYGMISPDEDSTTILAEMIGSAKEYKKLLTLRIEQKNFELPVKTLVLQLFHGFQYRTTGPIDEELLSSLEVAFKEADSEVKETTADAFAVVQKGLPILKKLILESENYCPRDRKL